MPVAHGEELTRLQILLYSIQLVAISLIPGIALLFNIDMLGIFYLVSATLLGGGLVYMAWWLIREPTKALARATYKYSSMYLAMLFLAMVVDRMLLLLFQ
jgi:protoheme IX farnesyltransferase